LARQFGLIGASLGHSFSPKYFGEKFIRLGTDDTYEAIETHDPSVVNSLFEKGLTGLNVTIPYKEAVIPYLYKLSSEAEKIGAVNTICKYKEKLYGFNTDVFGFRQCLINTLLPFDITKAKAVILGTGGASKAVSFALSSLGVNHVFVSRNPEEDNEDIISYAQLNANGLGDISLIVNTTPLGTFPDVNRCPDIPVDTITHKHVVYDLIYNPEETALLQKAKSKGATVINGYQMLVLQAERSWDIWNNTHKYI